MDTTVFLVRHGVTDWHRDQRILGHRDLPLNDEGRAQARRAAAAFAGVAVGEVLTSPLLRAMQTAEEIAACFGSEIARDPRLIDVRVGAWEGLTYEQLRTTADYGAFLDDPLTVKTPGGESLDTVRDRAVAAIEQAIRDVPTGEKVVVVTHATIVRLVLAHYLGSHLKNFHRLRVLPGSASILSFRDDRSLPRVLAMNCLGPLLEVLVE